MRTFDLVRDEDVTGISGTGRVAQGVVFDDGAAVLRWLTDHRSTTVFPSLETLEAIHGHGGKTRVAFHDAQPALVALPLPHLRLGNEGEFASAEYDQGGGGPADLRAHIAYDRLGKIEAPPGWSAHACWFVDGDVCLMLESPSRYLGVEEFEMDGKTHRRLTYEQQKAEFRIPQVKNGALTQVNERNRPGSTVRVDGKEFRAHFLIYSTVAP